MKRGNVVERRKEDLAKIHFLERTLVGEIEIQRAHGEKDLK